MKLICPTAIAASALLSSPAFAEEFTKHRLAVTAGYAANHLGGDAPVPFSHNAILPIHSEVEHDREDSSLSLGLSWHINTNIAVELWGAGKFDAGVELDVENGPDASVARYQTQPMSLSVQYHATHFGDRFKPYVGIGYHRTRISGIARNPQFIELDGLHINSGKGLAISAGLDVALTQRWFVRGDVRQLRWDTESYTHSKKLVRVDMNSVIYGVSMGLRF